jgi:hypothetical protein
MQMPHRLDSHASGTSEAGGSWLGPVSRFLLADYGGGDVRRGHAVPVVVDVRPAVLADRLLLVLRQPGTVPRRLHLRPVRQLAGLPVGQPPPHPAAASGEGGDAGEREHERYHVDDHTHDWCEERYRANSDDQRPRRASAARTVVFGEVAWHVNLSFGWGGHFLLAAATPAVKPSSQPSS